jgi:2-oxoglutarate dehydrogenase E2 component (dihydrolipoamide succinyltransferase)
MADGVNLTFLALVAAATVRGLRENPLINARVLDNAFVMLKHINLGIAVETPEGLVVPVVRDADRLTVRGLAVAIDEVAQRARAGKITADDLAGATFTISNPGLKGNFVGAAVISQPNVGILRTGEMVKRPVVVEQDGQDMIAIHPVMFAALSYDHRIVDGVAANNFLYRVTELLEAGTFDV